MSYLSYSNLRIDPDYSKPGIMTKKRKERIMYKQVKEIIEIIRAFHFDLGSYYFLLKDKAGDQRACMMLDYLSRREEYIAEYLEKYLHDAKEKALNVWIKHVPCLPNDVFAHCLEELEIVPPLYVDDILDIAMQYDDCLVRFFSALVDETESTRAKDIFSNLLNAARKEEMKLSQNTLWLNDL